LFPGVAFARAIVTGSDPAPDMLVVVTMNVVA
jgi:hypothetical protein